MFFLNPPYTPWGAMPVVLKDKVGYLHTLFLTQAYWITPHDQKKRQENLAAVSKTST